MKSLLLVSLFALAAGPRPLEPTEVEAPRVTPRAGRVELVEGETRRSLSPREGAVVAPIAATLDIGARGRADVAWTGSTSLRVTGPARIRWEAPGDAGGDPRVVVESLGTLEWEVRAERGELELDDPAFRLVAGSGAWSLTHARGGAVDVGHHGGEELRIHPVGSRPAGTWRAVLRSGESTRLTRASR